MKDLIKKEITMTSLEIAEYTGKKHFHVTRDIKSMFNALGIDHSMFGSISKDSYGRDQNCFTLAKKEILCLVSGYSIKLRMAIIDRLEELENQKPALPESKLEWMELAVETEKQKQLVIADNKKLAGKIIEDKPMVEFAKTVEGAKDKISIGAMAKISGLIGRNRLFHKLRDNKILIPFGNERNRPYQTYMDRGYFEISETVIKRTSCDQITTTTHVTGKGQVWLMKKIKEWA